VADAAPAKVITNLLASELLTLAGVARPGQEVTFPDRWPIDSL
jgi:hypothetical protein